MTIFLHTEPIAALSIDISDKNPRPVGRRSIIGMIICKSLYLYFILMGFPLQSSLFCFFDVRFLRVLSKEFHIPSRNSAWCIKKDEWNAQEWRAPIQGRSFLWLVKYCVILLWDLISDEKCNKQVFIFRYINKGWKRLKNVMGKHIHRRKSEN